MTLKRILFLLDLCLSLIFYSLGDVDFSIIIMLTTFTTVLSLYNIATLYNFRLSLSSVLLLYIIFTQFGLVLPYYFVGDETVEQFPYWALGFLSDKYLPQALIICNIAIISYELPRLFIVKVEDARRQIEDENFIISGSEKVSKIATVCLGAILLYFIVNILTGVIKLFGTYGEFMDSPLYTDVLYHIVLILFYLSTLFLSTCGSIKDNKAGWLCWLLIALIFAMNGNKGEFMYALLSVLGVRGSQGQKISPTTVVIVGLIVFLVIPTITTLRGQGIVSNISSASPSAFAAFTEMGMQIRTCVYTLEHLDNGTFDFLYGQSYWQPIVNILTPFNDHEIATMNVRRTFPGYGYSQTIESYLNFGILGVIGYFSIVGGLLCKYENKFAKDIMKLALLGSITCTLINVTRNYFAFVPGHILIAYVYYLCIKKITRAS